MAGEIEIEILETRTREPSRLPLPSRDPQYRQVRQVGEELPGQPAIFVALSAWETMREHTAGRTDIELGGLVVGHFGIDGETPFVRVDAAIPALKADGAHGSLHFTTDAVIAVDEERERRYPELRVVGWYHSHPGFGVFLSGTDLGTHRAIFKGDSFLAIVLDPVRQTEGVFSWLDGEIRGPLGHWVVEA